MRRLTDQWHLSHLGAEKENTLNSLSQQEDSTCLGTQCLQQQPALGTCHAQSARQNASERLPSNNAALHQPRLCCKQNVQNGQQCALTASSFYSDDEKGSTFSDDQASSLLFPWDTKFETNEEKSPTLQPISPSSLAKRT